MSSHEPLVSIVIPTHNRCYYLELAIQSVLAQSYSNFEVIVVDDSSADETATVVGDIRDARVRYLCQVKAGRSTARNRGMAVAEGVYLAFLDDDDLFLSHKLAQQVLFLETHPDIDLIGAGVQLIEDHGKVHGIWRPWEDQPNLIFRNCLYSCPLIPSTVVFRRCLLDRLDHWFDPRLSPAEDTDLFIRLLHAGCRMDWLPEIVSAYRVHNANSQSDGARYSRAYQRMLDKLFACPDLPADVLAEESRLRAHYYLGGACHAYASGQTGSAQEDLIQALTLNPTLEEGFPPPLVVDVANFASSFRVTNASAYIRFVFDHLPASLAHLYRYRKEAFTALHLGRVFRSHTAGKRPLLKDWLLGVYYAPRWLRNWGVWSILLREILGLPFPTR
ncbi:MAG: glycosyltransferase [Anaerolineae bacterium]|nr:glycosyltransferase [Anaerolineae bacterium]